MQRSGAEFETRDSGQLSARAVRTLHRVALWADARAVLSDVALYGDRLFGGASSTPLNLAVRYDQSQMIEGFDDWIEQLRTDFAGLRASVAEPLNILTPDYGAAWSAIVDGVELGASRDGKVRLISALAPRSAPAGDDQPSSRRNWWILKPGKRPVPAHAALSGLPMALSAGR
jgi:hypothetical protein